MATKDYTNTCDGPGCTASRDIYEGHFATCDSCGDEFCVECLQPGTYRNEQDEAGETGTCKACWEWEAGASADGWLGPVEDADGDDRS